MWPRLVLANGESTARNVQERKNTGESFTKYMYISQVGICYTEWEVFFLVKGSGISSSAHSI